MIINFNPNRLLSIFGSIIFIVCLISLRSTIEKKNANDLNFVVTAEIIEAPSDCAKITTRNGYCKLKFKGRIYSKRAGNKFCHLVSGKQTVEVLTNKEQNNLYFIGEYNSSDFWSAGILLVFSIIIFVKGLK